MTKKQYSIRWKGNSPVSFEIDGAVFNSLDDVPNKTDRRKLEAMMKSAKEADFDTQVEKPKRQVRQIKEADVEKTMLSVATGIAALLLLIAAIASFGNILRISREQSAPGRVVELALRPAGDGQTVAYFPVVEFTASDGRQRLVEMNEGSNPPAYKAGDEVIVRYNPQRPNEARIESAMMWVFPGIAGMIGAVFLGGSLVAWKSMPPPKG